MGSMRRVNYLVGDHYIFLLNVLMMITPFIFLTHHAIVLYGPHEAYVYWIKVLPALLLLLSLHWIKKRVTVSLDWLEVMGKAYFIFILAYSLTPLLLTTPFPFVDKQLLNIDLRMHFHLSAVMEFMQQHQHLYQLTAYVYSHWVYELLLLLIFLACFHEVAMANRMIHMIQIALFVASVCFYFWPSFGPLTVLHDPFPYSYAPAEHAQYWAIHHGLSPTVHGYYYAGFISFPSIHCFIASLAIYIIIVTKKLRWFLAPLIPLYLMVIASTLLLGEHYLIDLIAAECLLFSMILLRWIFNALSSFIFY